MIKSYKLNDHILVGWVTNNPNEELYEFHISKHNSAGIGVGRYAQGSAGNTCSYKELLNGRFQEFVVQHFGESVLLEVVVIVKMIETVKEVHRLLGPGLKDTAYKEALYHELTLREIPFLQKHAVSITYKHMQLNTELELDLLVENFLIVNIKSADSLTGLDQMEMKTSLRLSKRKYGLIINYNVQDIASGIQCVIDENSEKH